MSERFRWCARSGQHWIVDHEKSLAHASIDLIHAEALARTLCEDPIAATLLTWTPCLIRNGTFIRLSERVSKFDLLVG